jgi:hypothetical protein
VPAAELQALLVERRGVIALSGDLPFNDPSFAAFQWIGVESGLSKMSKLTRAEGAARFARVVKFEGKSWNPPDSSNELLVDRDVDQWLKQAGYRPRSDSSTGAQIDLEGFASRLYEGMKS